MFKRLALLFVSGLVAATVGVAAASAQDDFFTLTMDKTAFTNQFKTALTVTGTYSCSVSFEVNPDFTGMGVNVSQIQGKGTVVSGGSGFGPVICDGVIHPWSVTDVYANFGSGPMGGIPATWKGGRATADVNGNVSAGECQMGQGCQGVGADVTRVIQIR